MDKKVILNKIKELREKSTKRNFSQAIDLIINVKGINFKKDNQKIDKFFILPYLKGKKIKICAVVDDQLLKAAKEVFDLVIPKDELALYGKDKKKTKKLAKEYSFFVAQANMMGQVAMAFGKVLGPRGKMPNPKAGCVVLPNTNLKQTYETLQKTIRLITKEEPVIKVKVGEESMKDEEISENILSIYNQILTSVPNGKQNIKSILLKLTMSSPIKIEDKNG